MLKMCSNSVSTAKLHRISIIQIIISVKIRFHIQTAKYHYLKTHPRHSESHSTIHSNPQAAAVTSILWVQHNLILNSLLSRLSLQRNLTCQHQSFNIHLLSTRTAILKEIYSDLHQMMRSRWLQHIILIFLPLVWSQEIHQLAVTISPKIATNRCNRCNNLQLLCSNHHS